MVTGIQPSEHCGSTNDQLSGDVTILWGLDATGQLAAGQQVTAPTPHIYDETAGGVEVPAMLVGTTYVVPNDAGVDGQRILQAVTGAVAGHTYRLLVEYTPSPPGQTAERLGLYITITCLV